MSVLPLFLLTASARSAPPRFLISFPLARSAQALDGRLLLIVSVDSTSEPRSQVSDAASTAQIFGIDVDAWKPGTDAPIDARVFGYPLPSLSDLKPGRYRVVLTDKSKLTVPARVTISGTAAAPLVSEPIAEGQYGSKAYALGPDGKWILTEVGAPNPQSGGAAAPGTIKVKVESTR